MSDNRRLDALSCRGVLVNVSVRYWRARKKLNPENLGLSADQVNARLIGLGHKKSLPKDCLRSLARIESRAHALVEENTFPFVNGVARYLPNERLTEAEARLSKLGTISATSSGSSCASTPPTAWRWGQTPDPVRSPGHGAHPLLCMARPCEGWGPRSCLFAVVDPGQAE